MTHTAEAKVKAFFSAFAHANHALLLLDYDGTLAPFRLDRFKARPWAGVRELLNRIQDPDQSAITTKIIFFTGRPAVEVAVSAQAAATHSGSSRSSARRSR